DGIRDPLVTGVQTCALPIWKYGISLSREMETGSWSSRPLPGRDQTTSSSPRTSGSPRKYPTTSGTPGRPPGGPCGGGGEWVESWIGRASCRDGGGGAGGEVG